MGIHKLAPERPKDSSSPFSVSVAFQHDLCDLGEAVIKTRAIQAFDVSAEGYRKAGYCSCTFNVWAASKELADQTRAMLLRVLGPCRVRDQMFVIDWQFCNSRGTLVSTSFDEIADDVVLDEAYPHLGGPVVQFIERYLSASETVLILLGPPGMGKTRLVRAILGAMSRRKQDSAMAMYTADKTALEGDEIFVDFITGLHDAFVIEDADHLLQPRTDGNRNLHRFLMIADGVVRAQNRKIIFTTNLPNIGSIDEALLRPGRCFATIQMRPLTVKESAAVLSRLLPGNPDAVDRAREALMATGRNGSSLAAIYRVVSAYGSGSL
ncbi:MAG: ATP-binding protein [Steroidobacteraceae bacterium]